MKPEITGPNPSGCLALIRSYLPNMSPSNKRVAQVILDNPEVTLNLSIIQLAQRANVNPSTVTRFCTSIGYLGFPEFKSALRMDILATDNRFYEDVYMDDPVSDIVQKVFDLGIQGLRDSLVTLDPLEVHKAAEAITNANRVCCAPTGMASSGIVSLLSQKLLNLGIFVLNFNNPAMAPRYIDTLRPGDVVIAVSHSGSSRMIVSFLEQCRAHSATTICITNYIDAPIAKVSDIRLITAAGREAPLRGEPIGVRLTQVALVDTLYTVLSVLSYQKGKEMATTSSEPKNLTPS